MTNSHEPLGRPAEQPALSDRRFGLSLAGAAAVFLTGRFFLFGAIPSWQAYLPIAVILAVAVAAPALLAPLNRIQRRLVSALQKLAAALVMATLFFGIVSPFALALRLFGRKPLTLGPDPAAVSYWIVRQPPGPSAESLRQPF